MKKKFTALLLCFVTVLALSVTAYADMGPKPFVHVLLKGDVRPCYATLLSEEPRVGPYSAWEADNDYWGDEDPGGAEIWQKFRDYSDSDGFYFLQHWWDCTERVSFEWSYMPPSTFKVLLYFPETDSYAVSPICDRYAFSADYVAQVSGGEIVMEKDYNYAPGLISMLIRIVLTILIELVIALLFGYRNKKALAFLAVLNIITQAGLNLMLWLVNYASGALAMLIFFFLLEIVIVVVEWILDAIFLPRLQGGDGLHKVLKAFLYSTAANAASFFAGLWLTSAGAAFL